MKFLARVAENVSDAVRFGPTFVLRHLSYFFGRSLHPVTVDGFRVYLRKESTDAVIFRQIFRNGDWDFTRFPQAGRVWHLYYSIIRAGHRPVIIDAGANVGAASLWFARRFSEASILAVEPDPENAKMCRMNTEGVQNITVIEAAIGSSSGTASLTNSVGTSISVQTKRSNAGRIKVCTVPELVQDGRLLIIKIDIEGFEADLFSGNTSWLDQVGMVMAETHDWMMPGQFSSSSLQQSIAQRPFEMLVSGENIFYVK